jgi:branched-chain amino acid transport system ATP-binding protein
MLNVSKLCVSYGSIQAVRDLELTVQEGQFVAMVGSNGAGKSSALNAIAGLIKPSSGQVIFEGTNVAGKPTHRIVRRGLTLVPEGRMVAAPLTVGENLRFSRLKRTTTPDFEAKLAWMYDLFPVLKARSAQLAGSLSGGEQQMLAVARAVLTEPKLLLLDEPSMGLGPAMVDTVIGALLELHREGQTVLLVEQNAELALEIADYGYILQRGVIAAAGLPDELRAASGFAMAVMG